MTQVFRYKTIFMYGSLQSVGHTMDYFTKHTRKLVIFIVMPRVNNTPNILRVYRKGRLVEERLVSSSSNIFLYYLFWWWCHNYFLLKYIRPGESAIVFAGHPLAFIGMSIMGKLRRVRYAYWVGDYFPPVRWSLQAYERLKKYYHDCISVTFYLSDMINAIMNGKIVNQKNKKTVMWGVKVNSGKWKMESEKKKIGQQFRLLFVGVVRLSQGLEDIFSYLVTHRDIRLRVVGVCEAGLYERYHAMIDTFGIGGQVDFPNSFLEDEELAALASGYHVGVALYERSERSSTFYTDPGKVKTYVDLGLPVIMTNTSAIAPFVKKYRAGVVIDEAHELPDAIDEIKNHYGTYQKGLRDFSRHFEYEKYYKQAFRVFERG